MRSKILFFFVMILFFNTSAYSNIKIIYKINDEIITNIDIENEINYLLALNTELKKLEKYKLMAIAKDSLIREKIKRKELIKYFILNQKNPLLKKIVESFYIKLNIKNEDEFEKYLTSYNLTLQKLLEKIEIETTWNELIYEKYSAQIKIDRDKIKEKMKSNPVKKSESKYQLSEILFENKNKDTLENQFLRINESINEIGFKNTASTFSIADSAKFGGNIGWVDEFNLSKKIVAEIKKLKINEITKPLLISGNYLIIKLDNKKIKTIVLDNEENLEKLIVTEKNRQLNQFSNIYYNKVKINTYINEL
jgi:peptidyl-prolyl cis-trans isomerase SurA